MRAKYPFFVIGSFGMILTALLHAVTILIIIQEVYLAVWIGVLSVLGDIFRIGYSPDI